MHPRESIPNVGRRARGHRATTFTLKGNSVSRTTATTTTASATTQNASTTTTTITAAVPSKLHPPETGDVYSDNGHVRRACAECGCVESDEEGLVGAGEDSVHLHHPHHHHHFHHHPYGRILQRLARRRQITTEPDTHSRLELDPQGDYVPSPIQAATRAGRNMSNAHSHRPSPRTDEQRSTHNQTRWKGSKTARRNQKSEEHTPQQFFPRQNRSEKPGRMDLSGGCLTGRNPASHPPDHDEGDASPEMPDTTRSEPGDMSRMNREARRQAARRSNHDDLLDELFDYYWVYQGMGRQVLNLDLPREVWDKKLLRRPAKLPPISAAQEEAVTEQTPPGEGGHHHSRQAGHRSRRSEKAALGRRALSEPACSPNALQSQVFGAREKEIQNRLPVSHRSGSNSNSLVFEPPSFPRRTTRDLNTNHTTRKLVVKMPVMTKDKTRVDLLEKDG